MIETVADPLDQSGPMSAASRGKSCKTNWAIAMSMGIDADTRRIFQALTLPEYLEAWIEIPGRTPDSWVGASQIENGYCLSHCFPDRAEVSITSSYLFCHRRKMRLLWRKASDIVQAESLVDFRLRGNFGGSILELRHIKLGSAEEFFWHQKLWQGSLGKLAFLLRSV